MDAIAQVADASDKVAMRYFEVGLVFWFVCVVYRTVGGLYDRLWRVADRRPE